MDVVNNMAIIMDVVIISGALATQNLWCYQEDLFKHKRIYFVDILNSDSISEMAYRFSKIAPQKFTLIGFSMGGYIALELYRLLPNNIEKLILINTAAKLLSEKGQSERERSIDLITKGKFDFLVKLIFKNSICDKEKYNLLLPLAQSMAYEVGPENYIKQLQAMLNKPDHSSMLENIVCPTLILASQEDQVMPYKRSTHLASRIKHSELVPIEKCGHMAMLEQPERINQLLNSWL